MLVSKNIKTIFTFLFCIMLSMAHSTKTMELFNLIKNPTNEYSIFWHIVIKIRCSKKNTCGKSYLNTLAPVSIKDDDLETLNTGPIEDKNGLFSFLHRPFATEKPTCLINPQVSKYNLTKTNGPALNGNKKTVEEVHIICTGQMSTNGMKDDHSFAKDGVLQQAIIAMMKEHIIEKNYASLLEKMPVNILSRPSDSFEDRLKKVIQKELSFAEFEAPRTDEHNAILKRHFPLLLAKKELDGSLGKQIYSQLNQSEFSLEPFPYAVSTIPRIDQYAEVVCEKYDITICPPNEDLS